MTGDAVDHGVGGRETGRDPVVAGLAQHGPGDRRPLAVETANDSEREAAAGRVVRAGLDADKTVVPEKDVASENGAQLGGPHHRLSANKHASVPLDLRDTRAGNP